MKRLPTKLLTIAAVLAVIAIVAGVSAYGYFFSGQTVENNKIRAGEIRLQLNDGGAVLPIDLNNGVNDIMPGEHGTEAGWKISNVGNNAGSLLIMPIADGEWDVNFGDVLLSTFWLDRNDNGVWDTGDSYFNPDGLYVDYQTADGVLIPAAAFQKMNRWTTALMNTMPVPVGDLGRLKFSWVLPAGVIDTPEKPIMGKSCNFDLLIQIDQAHDPMHKVYGATSGHSPVTVSLYNGGFLSNTTVCTGSTYEIYGPAVSGYTITYTWAGGSYTNPTLIDLTMADVNADIA